MLFYFLQISGQKQVILYSPQDGHKLYEGHIPEAVLSFNKHNYAFRRKKLLDSTSMVMSPVDIVSPDIQVCNHKDCFKFYAMREGCLS